MNISRVDQSGMPAFPLSYGAIIRHTLRQQHAGLFILFTLFLSDTAHSMPITDGLTTCGSGHIARVSDGETMHTTDDRTVKLAGIKAPELWPADAPYDSWPYAAAARATLSRHALDKDVTFFCEGETKTYHGAIVAHIVLPDGHWLQHRLITEGAAYVFPRASHITGVNTLYDAEENARIQNKGLWGLPGQHATVNLENVRTGWFQIVHGTVLSAKKARGTVYLNFGENWRTDFTAEIPATAQRLFKRADIDLLALEGQNIEVRGWVDWRGGPRLNLEGPGQLKLLPPNEPTKN